MKSLLIGASLVLSVSSFAGDNEENRLFGEYPAKYHCIKKNRKIVKCYMPSVQDMSNEIAKYNETIAERHLKLDKFLDQANPYKDKIIEIGDEWYNEIGDNAFSRFYISYAQKVDQMVMSFLPKNVDARKEIGEDGEYINFLKEIKTSISEGMSEEEFGDITFSRDSQAKIADFHKLMSRLDQRYNFGSAQFSLGFGNLIPMTESCTKLKGYGQFQSKRVSIYSFGINPTNGFDIIDDHKELKELLSSNNGEPIKVACHKVKRRSDLSLSYDKTSSTLKVPYVVKKGFGSVAGSFNFEFKKSIDILNQGFFSEELKEVLK